MRKIFYSIIVIAYTVFTICVINYYGRNEYWVSDISFEKNVEQQADTDARIEENREENVQKDKEEKDEEKKENDETGSKEMTGENEGNTSEKDKSIDGESNKKPVYEDSQFEKAAEGQEAGKEESGNSEKPVLKVPVKEIPNKISLNDKLKLLAYSKKLSRDDYEKIVEYIKNYDPRHAIKNTFNILDDKLSDEDIEEIKEIFSDCINFSSL